MKSTAAPTWIGPMQAAAPWWQEREIWLLIMLLIGGYGLRLNDLSIRGEESRWATVAFEMLDSGDWVVPRQQGEPFYSRPPLGSWTIAASSWWLQDRSPLAIRLPTFMALMSTTILVYGYSRRFLSKVGATAAGLALATFAQMLQLGRLAETDVLFMALLAGSLLLWHWLWNDGWHQTAWLVGGIGAALATLAKGPQAPVYFFGSVILWLLLTGLGRQLWSRATLSGVLAFSVVFGAWQGAFAWQLGWAGVERLWCQDVAGRFEDSRGWTFCKHLLLFPLELWACLLPWSLLLGLIRPGLWRWAHWRHHPTISFLLVGFAVAMITCWLPPLARTRYMIPTYPLIAVGVGLAVDQLAFLDLFDSRQRYWNYLLTVLFGILILLLGLIVFVGPICWLLPDILNWLNLDILQTWRQPLPLALGSIIVLLGCCLILQLTRQEYHPRAIRLQMLVLACLLSLIYAGPIVEHLRQRSQPTGPQIAALVPQLRSPYPLISFGPTHHLFAFYYPRPIPLRPWPSQATEVAVGQFFSFHRTRGQKIPTLPFRWQEIAILSCDRHRRAEPFDFVVVGQRLPEVDSPTTQPMPTEKNAATAATAWQTADMPTRRQ